MKTKLTLLGNVTCCNGSMSLEIYDKDVSIYCGKNFQPGPLRVDLEVDWPTTVNIFTSNKAPGDHEIDTDGHIVKDKAIEITGVSINNFAVHQDMLDKIFVCRKQGSMSDTNENWWGFNGVIKLKLDQASPMRYMLSMNNEFQMNRLDWTNDAQ